jgi:maltose alpha-D-glucosyltransferase/alpha-amylase
VLCVANLSDVPQSATIDLGTQHARAALTDLFGGAGFPTTDADGRVSLTLGPRGYYWLAIGGARG